jgi:transmembrane sensor
MAREPDSAASISEEALHWWVLLHDESASAADHREFGDWVARSPERVAAYLRAARLHQAVASRETPWPAISAEALIREAKAAPPDALPLSRGASDARQPSEQGAGLFRMRFALGLAAALLVAVGFAWFALSGPQKYSTKFGEQRSVLLDDGSRVTLNTASKMEVELRKNRRLIRLVEGEALFEVAHDVARPFDVRTGDAVLRAVGTQFDVDVRPSHTTVTVVEGRVALISASGQPEQAADMPILGAADRLVISATGPRTAQHGANVAAAIAWMQRRLVFEHRPLGEVAEEFNRYNRDRIEIESAQLRGQEITGAFQSNDVASFVSFLSSIPGVEIRTGPEGAHIIGLKSPASSN